MIEFESGGIQQPINFRMSKNGKGEKGAWATLLGWDKMLVVFVLISLLSALAALFILLTPILDVVFNFMGLHYSAWNIWNGWVMEGTSIYPNGVEGTYRGEVTIIDDDTFRHKGAGVMKQDGEEMEVKLSFTAKRRKPRKR